MTKRLASIIIVVAVVGFVGAYRLRNETAAPVSVEPTPARGSGERVAARAPVYLSPVADRPALHPDGPERLAPRDPSEWQGMRVDLARQQICETTAQCGLARACIAGSCGACTADSQCADGESCVLDHCVVRTRVGCRSRRDCTTDAVCVLGDYSADPRGNAEMSSRCLAPSGGEDQRELPQPETSPAERPAVDLDDLQRSL